VTTMPGAAHLREEGRWFGQGATPNLGGDGVLEALPGSFGAAVPSVR